MSRNIRYLVEDVNSLTPQYLICAGLKLPTGAIGEAIIPLEGLLSFFIFLLPIVIKGQRVSFSGRGSPLTQGRQVGKLIGGQRIRIRDLQIEMPRCRLLDHRWSVLFSRTPSPGRLKTDACLRLSMNIPGAPLSFPAQILHVLPVSCVSLKRSHCSVCTHIRSEKSSSFMHLKVYITLSQTDKLSGWVRSFGNRFCSNEIQVFSVLSVVSRTPGHSAFDKIILFYRYKCYTAWEVILISSCTSGWRIPTYLADLFETSFVEAERENCEIWPTFQSGL